MPQTKRFDRPGIKTVEGTTGFEILSLWGEVWCLIHSSCKTELMLTTSGEKRHSEISQSSNLLLGPNIAAYPSK